MGKSKRKSNSMMVLLISMTIIYFFRLVMQHILESKGMAYFAVINESFFLFGFGVSMSFEYAIGSIIEGRMQRGAYDTVKKIIRTAILMSIVLSVLLSLFLLLLSKFICKSMFGMPLAHLSFVIMLICLPLIIVSGVLRGYFNGIGYRRLSGYFYIIFAALYTIVGLVLSTIFMSYGNKVSVLLRSENFKYTYGTLGFSIALIAVSLLSLIYCLVIYMMYERGTILNAKEYSKSQLSLMDSIKLIIRGLISPSLIFVSVFFISFIDSLLVLRKQSNDEVIVFNFGEYYSKAYPLMIIAPLVLYIFLAGNFRKAIGAARKDQYRAARERLARLIHRSATLSLFLAGLLIIFGENILALLFKQNGAAVNSYIYLLSILVFFITMAIINSHLLYEMRYGNIVGMSAVICMVIDIIISLILSISESSAIYGIIIGDIVFFALWSAISFLFVCRAFQYTQEWFRTIIVSLIAAIFSTLIGMLINKALIGVVGYLISLVIVLLLSILAFMVILLLLRGYEVDELEESLAGRLMIIIGRTFRLM